MSKEIKWIKLVPDWFNDSKIKQLKTMPERYALTTIWFCLLGLAGISNNYGKLTLGNIPYDEKMLSNEFDIPEHLIQLALNVFKKLGMIEILDEENCLYITNWEKHQNLEGMEKLKIQWKEASKRYRENKKLEHHKASYDGTYDVIEQNKNKNIDKDIRSLPLTPSKKGEEKNERDFFIKIKNLKTFKTYNNNKLLEHLAENYKELALEEAEKIDKKEREKFDDEPKIKDPGAYLLTALKNIKQNTLHA